MKTTIRILGIIALIALLAACGQSPTPPNDGNGDDEVIIPPTTKVLDADARSALVEVDDEGTLTFAASSAVAAELEAEDVVVSEPAGAVPHGLLREVTSVRRQGDAVIVETTGAEIRDAVHQGSLSVSLDLDEAALDQSIAAQSGIRVQGFDHTLDTDFGTGDRLKVSGTVEIDPILDLDMGISCNRKVFGVCAELPDLDVLVRVGLDETASLTIEGQEELDFDEELIIARHEFAPLTFSIGPVPVVLTPILEIYLNARGELSADLSFETRQELTLAGGFTFNSDSGFEDISESRVEFDRRGVEFQGTADARAVAGGRFELLLYGVIGPFGSLEAGPRLQANANGLPGAGSFVWSLEGCLTGTVGIDSVDVLDLQYDTDLFDACAGFDDQENRDPNVFIDTPSESTQIFQGEQVALRANATDRDGQDVRCEWSSSQGADPVQGLGCEGEAAFSSIGERTLTVTVTDPLGATDTDSVTIDVEPEPDILVDITKPSEEDDRFPDPDEAIELQGEAAGGAPPHTFRWTAVVPFFDDQEIDIGTGASLSWTPSDDGDFFDESTRVELTLEVTDQDGITGSRTIDIFVGPIIID